MDFDNTVPSQGAPFFSQLDFSGDKLPLEITTMFDVIATKAEALPHYLHKTAVFMEKKQQIDDEITAAKKAESMKVMIEQLKEMSKAFDISVLLPNQVKASLNAIKNPDMKVGTTGVDLDKDAIYIPSPKNQEGAVLKTHVAKDKGEGAALFASGFGEGYGTHIYDPGVPVYMNGKEVGKAATPVKPIDPKATLEIKFTEQYADAMKEILEGQKTSVSVGYKMKEGFGLLNEEEAAKLGPNPAGEPLIAFSDYHLGSFTTAPEEITLENGTKIPLKLDYSTPYFVVDSVPQQQTMPDGTTIKYYYEQAKKQPLSDAMQYLVDSMDGASKSFVALGDAISQKAKEAAANAKAPCMKCGAKVCGKDESYCPNCTTETKTYKSLDYAWIVEEAKKQGVSPIFLTEYLNNTDQKPTVGWKEVKCAGCGLMVATKAEPQYKPYCSYCYDKEVLGKDDAEIAMGTIVEDMQQGFKKKPMFKKKAADTFYCGGCGFEVAGGSKYKGYCDTCCDTKKQYKPCAVCGQYKYIVVSKSICGVCDPIMKKAEEVYGKVAAGMAKTKTIFDPYTGDYKTVPVNPEPEETLDELDDDGTPTYKPAPQYCPKCDKNHTDGTVNGQCLDCNAKEAAFPYTCKVCGKGHNKWSLTGKCPSCIKKAFVDKAHAKDAANLKAKAKKYQAAADGINTDIKPLKDPIPTKLKFLNVGADKTTFHVDHTFGLDTKGKPVCGKKSKVVYELSDADNATVVCYLSNYICEKCASFDTVKMLVEQTKSQFEAMA